jgi:hypothetical protein
MCFVGTIIRFTRLPLTEKRLPPEVSTRLYEFGLL